MITRKTTQLIKSLHQKKYRQQQRLFLVEGAKSVRELLASSLSVKTIVATKLFLQQHQETLRQQSFDNQPIEVDEATLSSLSTFKNNNAALAVVGMPTATAGYPAPQEYGLVLDNIRDPGNLGTILRVADWYGIRQIVCSLETTDIYAPKVVSASMGSFLREPVAYVDLVPYLRQTSVPVYGAVLDQGQNVHQFLPDPVGGVIVLGNESAGIRPELLPFINEYLHIPRFGQAESLNVGVAAAVVCDNLVRLTRSAGATPSC